MKTVAIGLLIPFLGTALGAACVFFMRRALSQGIQKALSGFAAGAMLYVVVEELMGLLQNALSFRETARNPFLFRSCLR